jgi:polygalacturonase
MIMQRIIVKLVFCSLVYSLALACTNQHNRNISPESKAINTILGRINGPAIPSLEFNLSDYSSKAELKENIQPVLDKVIQECSNKGGGKVIIPAGEYFSKGPIHLLSNIHLYLEEGVSITFSQNPKDYLPNVLVRWEGVECYNYSPFIYAINQKNIRISGNGIFNGNAKGGFQTWRAQQKSSQLLLREMGRNQVPVEQRIFGAGHLLRPAFLQFVNCQNIEISDINVVNVPFWVIHPTYCKNVIIRNVKINSRLVNNDGCDIDSCEDVLIENCSFTTGDDAIAIKSGRDQDGWRIAKPSKNIVIRNCVSDSTLHGLAIGSEMSGGVENVFIQDFTFKHVDEYGIQFKANKDRGGYIQKIYIEDVKIETAKTPLFFTNDYHGYAGGENPSVFRDIFIKKFHTTLANNKAIDMLGTPEKPITNVFFNHISVDKAINDIRIENVQHIVYDQVFINGTERFPKGRSE